MQQPPQPNVTLVPFLKPLVPTLIKKLWVDSHKNQEFAASCFRIFFFCVILLLTTHGEYEMASQEISCAES